MLRRKHNFPSVITGVISVNEFAKAAAKHNNNELMAPGEKILSTKPGDQYDFYSGSSFSTAQVTGLIALIKERKPHMSTESIQLLLQASQIKNRSSQSQQTVSACRALARLVSTDCR